MKLTKTMTPALLASCMLVFNSCEEKEEFSGETDAMAAPSEEFSIAATGTTLSADGPGNTYELINSVLGGNAAEVPDCAHPGFGRHITEEFDNELNKNVFVFHMHVDHDGNLCDPNDGRQRCEIKTYGPSPSNLKIFEGDEVTYRWKFKLDEGFQPSPSFTHIHQIISGGGTAGTPLLVQLTPRYNSAGDRMELIIYDESGSVTKPRIVDLSGFKGEWVEVYEKATFDYNGTYEILIKRVSDGAVLLSYSSPDVYLWREGMTFCRPKWGIYRSLDKASYLRDEEVRFADFCLAKGDEVCPGETVEDEVTLHQNCNYGGWSVGFGIGQYTMQDIQNMGGINDDASAIRVPDGLKVTLYEDNNFQGGSRVFTSDDSCLIDDGFNDEVSSLIVSAN
ncbi:hypothetical protein [Sinomicrobium weinanense]|uniref:Uncharacterized protein n=1 Tax=Sinomicrobium weinanense TaxID=2842200 RepID=A0A926Q438_9FLAO|nr:hypothetical protein [Sinomicrobium weinanense]MBC9798203.1 hypothetical protein [Sinomicrobium weinanense]MBU3123303.1 hypothetical protein [Sinomicrobium weinanense]